MTGLHQRRDQVDDLGDRLGGERLGVRAAEPEPVGVLHVQAGHLASVFGRSHARLARGDVDLVVDVGDVDRELGPVSRASQEPGQEHRDHERAGVAHVDARIDGWPAGIDPDCSVGARLDRAEIPTQGVVYSHVHRVPDPKRWTRLTPICRANGARVDVVPAICGVSASLGRDPTDRPASLRDPMTGHSLRARLKERVTQAFATLPERYLGAEPGFDASFEIRLGDIGRTWNVRLRESRCDVSHSRRREPDVVIVSDAATWIALREGRLSGLDAFSARRLRVRGDLDLAVGFEGMFSLPGGRPPLVRVGETTTAAGTVSHLLSGGGEEHVICLHGLGGNKSSFVETISALAPDQTVHAIDLRFGGFERDRLLADHHRAIEEVLVESEVDIEAGQLHLERRQHHVDHPRLHRLDQVHAHRQVLHLRGDQRQRLL